MILVAAILFFAAMLTSIVGTFLAKRYANRLGLIDAPGHRKVHTIATPRNGGIGIFWGIALPILIAVALAFYLAATTSLKSLDINQGPDDHSLVHHSPTLFGRQLPAVVDQNLSGLEAHTPLILLLLAATAAIHILGLLDDRKPLPPWPKLLAQLAASAALVAGGESLHYLTGVPSTGAFRTLTLLDQYGAAGTLLSALLSILWITALTNAFNFLDNMDGLSAGVAFLCALMFLVAASLAAQWFICGLLIVFMGALLGFLFFNFPPASIFMGDGGSMVLGFFLSALTIRTTYYGVPAAPGQPPQHHWYTLLMPLIILAVPLYDLSIVTALRLAAGKSPMTGDTNHFSHRLTRHGFSKRSAVLVIYAVTLATGISAPLLALVQTSTAALLVGLQTASLLAVIALLERVGSHTHFPQSNPPDPPNQNMHT